MESEVGRLMEIIQTDLRDHDSRIATLEIENVSTKKDVIVVQKTLDKIDANTTWIIRLLVGAIVLALLGLVFAKVPAKTAASDVVSAYVA